MNEDEIAEFWSDFWDAEEEAHEAEEHVVRSHRQAAILWIVSPVDTNVCTIRGGSDEREREQDRDRPGQD